MSQHSETEPQNHADEMERARLKRSLKAMSVTLSPYAFEVAYARVSTARARGADLTDDQLKAIIDDVLSSSEILQGVAESFR